MKLLARFFEFLLLGGVLYAAAARLGPHPPLGRLLDPANGVWAVARTADLPRDERVTIPGLTGAVEVRFDDRAVPHIFATTEDDAYRALGYVVARDRLFQLEIQTRATAGTLSELLGPAVLALDREQRALGLAPSADRAFDTLPAESRSRRAATAYADGVNAYIARMSPADLPLEYRLLDAQPARWQARHSFYLMRRMGYTLAYQAEELRRRRVAELVGPAAADALFPVNSPIQEPIQPAGDRYPRYDWKRLPPPAKRLANYPPQTFPAPMGKGISDEVAEAEPDRVSPSGDGVGSNNWAVAPSRSATGHALLAGDPHLDLSLPSIWYEAHLVVRAAGAASAEPAELDVYGVTLPGAPGVVIGFNRDVAWSLTNTEADVMDYYAETVDDPDTPASYRVDGGWKPLTSRVEVFRDRDGKVLATDTVHFSHRGPITNPHGSPLSIRWTVLEAGGELDAVLAAQAATSAADWMEKTREFRAPAQNGLVADRAGNIAIRSTGRFPRRPGNGRGTEVQNGDSERADWVGNWELQRYPQEVNPGRGFLSSANQQPVDPRINGDYLGADWTAPWRALRINALLRADSVMTVDKMRLMQGDLGSARAEFFVPYFLAAEHASTSPTGPPNRRPADLLSDWNRHYDRAGTRAALFELAMDRLVALTWDELENPDGRRVATPGDAVLAELLQDSASAWWDRRATTGRVERRDDILRQSLAEAAELGQRRYGPMDAPGWRWDHVQHTNIYHLLRLPALSALDLPAPGARGTISPASGSGTNGSSWRMVVELGPDVRGWGTYPGGQSGNPVSARYLDRLDSWVAGKLDTLRTPRTAEDLAAVVSRLSITPGEPE